MSLDYLDWRFMEILCTVNYVSIFKFCVGLQQRLLTFPCWRCDAASSVWELRDERASEPAESKKHTKESFCTWPPPPPPSAAALSHSVTRSCHTQTHITLSHTHTCVAGTYGTGLAGVDRLDRGNIVRHCHTTLSHRSLSHTTSSHTTLSHTDNLVAHTTVSHATMSHADSF